MKKNYLIKVEKTKTVLSVFMFFVVLFSNTQYAQTLSNNCAGASTFNVNQQYTALTVSDNVINDPTAATCNSQPITRDGWLKFDAISNETVIKVAASSRNLMLYAYSGSCGSLTYLSCENATTGSGSQTETLILPTVSGTTYFIRVANTTNNSMSITSLMLLSNDKCSDAITLTSNPNTCVTTTGSTIGARDNNETGDCTTGTEKSVWYRFQAVETTHVVTVDGRSGFNAVVNVINNCGSTTTPSGGGCVNNTFDNGIETLTLTGLTIGNYYLIQIHDYNGDETANAFTICVTHVPTCLTPVAQPTSLAFGSVTTNSIAGSFTAAIPAPDKYLVLISTSATAPSPGPANGTTYTVGNTISGATVLSASNATSFTASGLTGNTRYYFYIYSYNDTLCNNVAYNTIAPLNGNNVTCPAVPNTVTTSGITSNAFTLNWAIPTGGSAASLNYTIQVTTDAGYTANIAGSPFTTSSLTHTITGLNGVTTYYYRIRANNSCSSNWVTGNITTLFPNDECSSAIPLSISSTCTYLASTNVGATSSSGIPAPGCANYNNNDAWYSAVVPSTGILNVELQAGTMTDSGMAFYSGSCGALTLLECDDDDGTGAMSSISMTGLTPGQIIYIRVWRYSGGSGTFDICATTPSCPQPSDLFANILSTSSASVYWSAPTPPASNGYQYFLSTTNTPPTGGSTPTGTTAPGVIGVTLTGLTNGQLYYLWVRSDCGGGDRSPWFGPTNFTPCAVGNGQGTTDLECPSIVAGGTGMNGLDPSAVVCTASTCSNLEATYPVLNSTSNYTVSAIAYNPPYQFGCLQNPVSVNVDDVWSQAINLPFNFCFFGNNYDRCLIGSNGNITFDLTNNTPGGYNAWSFNTNLPSTSLFRNTIFGVYHDIDPSVGGEIGWELITLDTGCRALVASWNDIPMFSSSCNSILYTGMIVLYENSNVIDVFIKEKNVCSTWNNGNAIVGIQNADATSAVVAPNRNGLDTDWTVTNEAWRFTPSGPSITSVKWYEGNGTSGPVVGTSNNISVCPVTTTTYTAEVTYNLCSGAQLKYTDNTTVTVNGNKIWTGSVDTDWNKANNWSPSGVPTSSNCVIIPDTTNDPVISGSNFKAYGYNMDIQSNANLLLNSNNHLTITDFAKVNGSFNIKDSSNFIQINDSALNTGTISMDRNTNVRKFDYVYWSSPVANFNSAAISPTTPSYGIYKWEPVTPNTNGGQGYWTSGSENMVLGKGYIVRGPNAYSASTPSIYTATFTGVPNNGIIQPTISRGSYTGAPYAGTNGATITNLDDNWNLIGNPYPSAINANTFLTNNTNINGTVRLWTHGNPISTSYSNPFYASYQYNYSVNDYVTYNGTGSTPPGFNGKIGAGQAFFVIMNDGAAGSSTVTFNNSLRSDNHDNSQFYRTSSQSTIENLEKNRIWLSLVDANNVAATTLVGYIENATNDEDRMFDGACKPGVELGIYSKIEDKTMLIQGRALPFNSSDTVPVGVTIPSNGMYNIAINQVDGLFEGDTQDIYLEDTVENTIHDLKQAPYSFNATVGNYPNRFILRYTTNALAVNDLNIEKVFAFITQQTIHIQAESAIKNVTVYDVSGKAIITLKGDGTSNKIENAFPYANGVYIAKIKLENGTTISKKLLN